jgi:CPA1 family monovalent cation:H+ antiporter
VVRALDRRPSQRARRVGWRPRVAGGWAGFRGAVSLAAALAVPMTLGSGAPFPDRDLIVFTTAAVILATVLVQGTTLPVVLQWAGLQEDTGREDETRFARARASEAALAALPQVAAELGIDGQTEQQVRAEYEQHAAAIAAPDGTDEVRDAIDARERGRRLRLGVLDYKRRAVTDLRDQNKIDDLVLRDLQATLDAEEIRLQGPQPAE